MSTSQVLLLTIHQVAKATALSPRTIRRETQRGSLPVVRVGRSVRYRDGDVVAFVDSHREAATVSDEKKG